MRMGVTSVMGAIFPGTAARSLGGSVVGTGRKCVGPLEPSESGSESIPRAPAGRSTPASPPARGRGSGGSAAPMASAPCSRASEAPRQWWVPLPKAEVSGGVGAAQVELVGGRAEDRRVVVGRPERREHERAGRHGEAADLDVGEGDAAGELHRRVEAQQLVDRRGAERSGRRATARAGRGGCSRAQVPLPMRFTVVSWPAM